MLHVSCCTFVLLLGEEGEPWISEIRRRGHWKRGICIQLSENDFQIWKTSLRQFCAPFLWCTKRNTSNFAQVWRAICDKFAQRPLRERPLLGNSENSKIVQKSSEPYSFETFSGSWSPCSGIQSFWDSLTRLSQGSSYYFREVRCCFRLRSKSSQKMWPFFIQKQTTIMVHSWFLILWSKLQKNGFSCRKNALSLWKMHFPTEKCTFRQKNAFSCRRKKKAHFPAENAFFFAGGGHRAGNRRRVSGFKNQERYPTFTQRAIDSAHHPCKKVPNLKTAEKSRKGCLR